MTKGLIISLAITVAFIGLFIWGYSKKQSAVRMVPGTEVACLTMGHQNLAAHIHPRLTITVDDVMEPLPANIGITPDCMAEVHTHDTTGDIHVETITLERLPQLNLSDFFAVWGRPVEREGYAFELLVDGEKQDFVEDVAFTDHAQIELKYISL